MVEVAVLFPSTVVTVIVAVPPPTAVTSPELLTVATSERLLLQVTFLFVAFAGNTVGVSCWVAPAAIVALVGVTETLVGITFATVMVHVAVLLPSTVVAVMVAFPAATPVTSPELLTVATFELLLLHVTFLFGALDG